MEISYWLSRWERGHTGFHLHEVYPGLKSFWNQLNIPETGSVLVPLCGKSLDLIWLSKHVASVVGVELSEKAIHEFSEEQGLIFSDEKFFGGTIYQNRGLRVWCGDFFRFPAKKFPGFHLIYDKAALVALPPPLRERYAVKICGLCTGFTRILLQNFIYNQHEMKGPPFSVSMLEISSLFEKSFDITVLDEHLLNPGNFPKFQNRGLKTPILEQLLLLSPKPESPEKPNVKIRG